jgi:integrase
MDRAIEITIPSNREISPKVKLRKRVDRAGATSENFEIKKNSNHPKKGSIIKVEPIRRRDDVLMIKNLLANEPRNLLLYTMGINTALRASDLLSITIGQVRDAGMGFQFQLRERKTSKKRNVTINGAIAPVLRAYLDTRPYAEDDEPLFMSSKYLKKPLTVSYVNMLVKKWCKAIYLKGNYGSHSLRKTWGYHQRVYHGTQIPVLMQIFNHSSQRQTLDYLGIQQEEVFDCSMIEI